MFTIGEVLEIKKAFKPNQKDSDGNPLPLGSVLLRMGGNHSILGNLHHIWARPSTFSRRVPLVGEHVIVYHGPTHDYTSGVTKKNGYFYIHPINSTDDLTLHQHPKLWLRQKGNIGTVNKSKPSPGKVFPKNPPRSQPVQAYEGDDIVESRFGSSIRLGATFSGPHFQNQQTWQGGSKLDPITIFRIKKPSGVSTGPLQYTIEDLSKDESSIYMTVSQKLLKTKVAFTKNLDAVKIPSFSKPQVLIDSDRVVINAKNDIAFLLGKKKVVCAGDKVILQSKKYYVDIDELMDWLKEFSKEVMNLATGKAQLATPAGPTAVATNASLVTKIAIADFNKNFKTPK